MRFLHFGANNNKVMVLFHASCMTWDFLEKSIIELEKYYHLIIPVMPGYDIEDDSDYTSVEEIANTTENYLLENSYNSIAGIYGISMGGSIVIRILANGRLNICKAVIDAGITPHQLPGVISKLLVIRDYSFMMTLKNSMKVFSYFISEEKYGKGTFEKLKNVMLHASRRTIWNNFKSCNTYYVPDQIENLKTNVEYWYGSKEKMNRRKDIKFVKKIFPKIEIREIKGYNHAEFVMLEPEEFARKIVEFIN